MCVSSRNSKVASGRHGGVWFGQVWSGLVLGSAWCRDDVRCELSVGAVDFVFYLGSE